MQESIANSQDPSAVMDELSRKVKFVAGQPGVYLMKDAQGRILYVGKSRNLKKRLQSYFQKQRPHDPKTTVMLTRVVAFETLLTGNEKEAFILESSLIKRHRPRYNVNLKDDKRYPSLKLDLEEPYPHLTIVRKIQNDGARYFGPYASSAAVRETLKFIHKTFKLRKCKTTTFMNRSRPCLNYQMGLCLAPCCLEVDPQVYDAMVKEVVDFLLGRTPALIRKIKDQMKAAARDQDFETAALLRDKMFALEKTLEKQVTITTDFKDRDVVSLFSDGGICVVTLMNVRSGFLQSIRHFFFEETIGRDEEQLASFLEQYYSSAGFLPQEIVVSHQPVEKEYLEELLAQKKGRKVSLMAGLRGDRAKLLAMAAENARIELEARKRAIDLRQEMLSRLQKRLGMETLPRRIECFDNSNWSGTQPVAAMVVFVDGQPFKDAYRRYKIRFKGRPDDYAYMAEVLGRRYAKRASDTPLPDLLLVDGGKGQLNVALGILKSRRMTGQFCVAGIAKKDPDKGEHQDKVYLAGRANAVQFGRDLDLLLFLQQIRDEAHRWAIGYQRKRRQMTGMYSELDQIAGIGPKRKSMLLKHFGGVDQIRRASLEALAGLPGITPRLARVMKSALSLNDVDAG